MEFTYITEQDWQEDEAMGEAQDQNGQVHSKVEHLEELGVSKGQNTDTKDTL